MRKSILLVFMATIFSLATFAKSSSTDVPPVKQTIDKVQPAKVDATNQAVKFRAIQVTIETTCGINVSFEMWTAPGATISDIENELAAEATGWNQMLCDETWTDWQFIWS